MGEPDVELLLARLGRDKFNRWLVAYHELHLDAFWPAAAEICATIHNEVGLAIAAHTGCEFEIHDREHYLPRMEFGPKDSEAAGAAGEENQPAPDRDAAIDAMFGNIAQAWSRKH
jgi:hypothetical protein